MTGLDAPQATADSGAAMRSASAAILAWFISGLTLAAVAATTLLVFLNRETIHSLDQASVIEIVLPLGFALLGGLVASRLPANMLGWVFLAISIANAIPGATTQYTRYAFLTQPGAPYTAWIPWFGNREWQLFTVESPVGV